MDQIALNQEVLAKRQEELEDVQHQLMLIQAKVTSERAQWSQQKMDEQKEIALKAARLEEQWGLKIQEAERQMRQQQQSLQIQKDLEHEVELRIEEIARQQQALADLSKERLEIELLRRQVEQRSDEVEGRWSACQDALNKGNDNLSRAQKIQEEVELRNLRLNELDVALLRREEAAVMREKQAQLASEELDRKIAEYNSLKAQQEEPKPPPSPEPQPTEQPEEPPVAPQPEEGSHESSG